MAEKTVQQEQVENNAPRLTAVNVLGWFLFMFTAKTKTRLFDTILNITATTPIKKNYYDSQEMDKT